MHRTRLLLILVFILFLSQTVSAQIITWSINPTDGVDYGYGTCLFGNYLVVVGSAGSSPFLALLDRSNGNVVEMWSKGSGMFTNCVAVGDKLYVVGFVKEGNEYYKIYVFDKNLNVINRIQVYNAGFYDIIYQDGYFYIGGFEQKNVGDQYRAVWYIEKRTSDLSLVAYREIYDVNWEDSTVYNVGVNPVTGDVWAVGYYKVGGVRRPLVAILDRDLNLKRIVQLPGYAGFFGGVCFDREGYAYVSGEVNGGGITIKFDKNGNDIKNYDGGGLIICIKDRIYLFSRVKSYFISGFLWKLVYDVIDMKTMERISQVSFPVTSIEKNNLTGFYAPGRPSFDGRYVYAAGVLDTTFSVALSPRKNTEIKVFAVPVVSAVKVVDSTGRPLFGFVVRGMAGGYSLDSLVMTDGVASFRGLAPDTVYVYDTGGRLVWRGNVTSLNATVVVHLANSFPATSPAKLRGYLVLRGVSFRDGSTRDVRYDFQLANGVLTTWGNVPLDMAYPADVYVTEFSIGSTTLAPRGGAYLVYSGLVGNLTRGLDFGNLFTRLNVSAVDSTGAVRRDWAVQLIYQGAVLAEGRGTLTAVVPRTSVLGQPYVVKVVTTALTPEGRVATSEQQVSVEGDSREVRVAVSTARVTVLAVDGFGQRRDWFVEIENVARGVGSVSAELLDGAVYTAKATGLGFTNVTKFVARGPEMVLAVKIPPSRITARVVDGFGQQRDWPVEIVGVASGQGSVTAEVLAGLYTVRATAFGSEFVRMVGVAPGQHVEVTVQVPTARLKIHVVDDDRKPIDQYVTSVEVVGPMAQNFSRPPGDMEVLAGQYTITITALGKVVSTQVELQPGQYATVEVLVPSTAGIDIGGTRITYSTLYTILAAAVAVSVVGFAVVKLRSKRPEPPTAAGPSPPSSSAQPISPPPTSPPDYKPLQRRRRIILALALIATGIILIVLSFAIIYEETFVVRDIYSNLCIKFDQPVLLLIDVRVLESDRAVNFYVRSLDFFLPYTYISKQRITQDFIVWSPPTREVLCFYYANPTFPSINVKLVTVYSRIVAIYLLPLIVGIVLIIAGIVLAKTRYMIRLELYLRIDGHKDKGDLT